MVSSYFTQKHRELRLIKQGGSQPALPMIPFNTAAHASDTSARLSFPETPVILNISVCLSGVLGWANWRRFGGSTSVPVGFSIPKRDGRRC